ELPPVAVSGGSAAWWRTGLGGRGSQVQILSPRPIVFFSVASLQKPLRDCTFLELGQANERARACTGRSAKCELPLPPLPPGALYCLQAVARLFPGKVLTGAGLRPRS